MPPDDIGDQADEPFATASPWDDPGIRHPDHNQKIRKQIAATSIHTNTVIAIMKSPPRGSSWVHELKLDGYRIPRAPSGWRGAASDAHRALTASHAMRFDVLDHALASDAA